ncbi:MAG: DUF2190 family protein [Lentisphaerae bacterium]|nr:DUF2190 family protein [Lentisphaerota bacterium]MCP4140708.1 DUF2190 family protein [Chloroflexota bacterium]
MKNQVFKKGDQFPIAASVAYVSGEIVLEGSLGGVAVADAVNNEVVADFSGVYSLPAVDGSYAVGDQVEATAAQGSVQALASGDLYGKVIEAVTVSGGDNNVKVRLVG